MFGFVSHLQAEYTIVVWTVHYNAVRGFGKISSYIIVEYYKKLIYINPYPTAFPYGNGMVLHFYQQQESSTTKTVHKVIKKGLKTYV